MSLRKAIWLVAFIKIRNKCPYWIMTHIPSVSETNVCNIVREQRHSLCLYPAKLEIPDVSIRGAINYSLSLQWHVTMAVKLQKNKRKSQNTIESDVGNIYHLKEQILIFSCMCSESLGREQSHKKTGRRRHFQDGHLSSLKFLIHISSLQLQISQSKL